MASGAMTCSESECKKRFSDVKDMSFDELEKYNIRCANCGTWILKDNDVANKTYHAVSNRWAEEFMNQQMKKK